MTDGSPDLLVKMRYLALLDEAVAFPGSSGVGAVEFMETLGVAEPDCLAQLRSMHQEGLLEEPEPGSWTLSRPGLNFFESRSGEFAEEELLPPPVGRPAANLPVPPEADVDEPDPAPAFEPEPEMADAMGDAKATDPTGEELDLDTEDLEDSPSEEDLEVDAASLLRTRQNGNGSNAGNDTRATEVATADNLDVVGDDDPAKPVPSSPKARRRGIQSADLQPTSPRQRILGDDPEKDTLDCRLLEFIRVGGGYGDAAVLTRLCRFSGFDVAAVDVRTALARLLAQKLIEQRDAPVEAYEACPAYSRAA
jgi:hypothetical protein